MTIWIGAFPVDTQASKKTFQPFAPPEGVILLKAKQQFRIKITDGVVESFNLFKFRFTDPTMNRFWAGDPLIPRDLIDEMDDELQTRINKLLCELIVETEKIPDDFDKPISNLTWIWYLPEKLGSPIIHNPLEEMDYMRKPLTLRIVNQLRAQWLLHSQFAT